MHRFFDLSDLIDLYHQAGVSFVGPRAACSLSRQRKRRTLHERKARGEPRL
jgi:hypothetical protein